MYSQHNGSAEIYKCAKAASRLNRWRPIWRLHNGGTGDDAPLGKVNAVWI